MRVLLIGVFVLSFACSKKDDAVESSKIQAKQGESVKLASGESTESKTSVCANGKLPIAVTEKPHVAKPDNDELDTVRCMSWKVGAREAVFTLVGEEAGDLNVTIDGRTSKLGTFSADVGLGGDIVWLESQSGDLVFINEFGGSGRNPGSTTALRIYWADDTFLTEEWTNVDNFDKKKPKWAQLNPDDDDDEVIRLGLAPAGPKDRKQATQKNTDGVRFLRKKDYPNAIIALKAALWANAGHILARYNLACANSLSGNTDEALRLLKEFKDNGCPACVARLVRARDDSDFAALHKDPRFLAITKDAKVNVLSTQDAALVVSNDHYEQSDLIARVKPKVVALVHPNHEIVHRVISSEGDGEFSENSYVGLEGFKKFFRNANPTEMKLQSCKAECCQFESKYDDERTLGTHLTEVCFKVDKGGFRYLVSISTTDEH